MSHPRDITVDCTHCKNDKCLIKFCEGDWLLKMSEKKNQVLFRKGRTVFAEGSPVFGAYFIQQGKVKIASSNLAGKKQIVRLACEGHMMGHSGYPGETYPIEGITIEDSSICFFDNQALYEAFIANPEFSFQAMMFYSKELRKGEQRTKFFAQMTVEEKIILALLYSVATFELSNKTKEWNIFVSRQDIADIVGTNAQQVSRTLTYLNEQKLINIRGKEITVSDYEEMKNRIARYKISLF